MISLTIHDSRLRSQWGRDQLYPDNAISTWAMEAYGSRRPLNFGANCRCLRKKPSEHRPSGAIGPFHGRPGGCGASRFAWTNCPAPWPGSSVCSPCAPFQSSKNGLRSQPFPLGTSASSPPCRGNLKWTFLPGLLRGFDQLPEVNPTLADGKLSPKFTTWRWRTPWVTFYTSQKGLTSNWTWSISKWLTYEIMLPSGQPT